MTSALFGRVAVGIRAHSARLHWAQLLIPFYFSPCAAEIHGAFTATSDYVWRGYSKSAQGFAFQANLDYEHSTGLYGGASASTVDFGDLGFPDRAQFEITPYLGWSTPIADEWRLDLQWTRYFFDGRVYGQTSDYNEFYWLLHYRDLATGRIFFSEDFYSRGHAAADFELSGRYPITDWLEFSGGVGYTLAKEAVEYDYLYWNSGFSVYFKYLIFDFRYFDAAETDETLLHQNGGEVELFPETLGPTLVFSVTIGF